MSSTGPQDPERWQALERIFARAVDLDEGARSAYLDEACGVDAELREQVEALLAMDEVDDGSIKQPVKDAAQDLLSKESDNELKDTVVGSYRLTEIIGYGGMGSVWRARRDDDVYEQDVAIKLMHRGLHNPELRARFAAERQILANLNHPRIASMMDGGTTETGVPYVIMEYVEGRPVDRFCDDEQLPTEQRLRLFRQICDAVSFAHRNLVVHRDIKPANILVTAEGAPKLLDFGIAKLMDPAAVPGSAVQTMTSMRLLTPEYASPEQVTGGLITTASDVYSLGVLLYVLLTGRRPYPTANLPPGELGKVICEQEPERPSTAVMRVQAATADESTGHTTAESLSAARASEPSLLRKKLHGDLDNIVLKALRKQPHERYASVDLLAEDIQRHLDGVPVSARPATLGYRLGKFVSRHRRGVAASALAIVAAISMLTFHTARLDRERARAEAEAQASARVADFLVDMFASADPMEARGTETSARELLDRGAGRIQTRLVDDPALRARLLQTMARAYYNLSELESGLELTASALTIQEQLAGSSPAKRSSLLRLEGDILSSLARYDEARATLEESLSQAELAHGADHEELIFINNAIGGVDELEGDFVAAEARYLRSVEAAAALPNAPDTLALADTLALLGRLQSRLGRHGEAVETLSECIRLRELLLDDNAVEKLTCIGLLGVSHREKGDYEAAEPLLVDYLALSRAVMGDEARTTASAKYDLATLYKLRGEPQRALPLVEETLATHRRLLGNEHPDVAAALDQKANLLEDLGRAEESVAPQEEALAIVRATLGEDHPEVATLLNNLASKMVQLGRNEEAEQLYLQVIELDRKILGDSHPYIPMDLANLAVVYRNMRRMDEAKALLLEALALQESNPDVSPVNLSSTLVTLGNTYISLDEYDEAETMLRRAVTVREQTLAPGSKDLATARHLLGRAILKNGRTEEARAIMEPSYASIGKAVAPGSPSHCFATERMVELYETLGDAARVAQMEAKLAWGAANGSCKLSNKTD